MKAAPIEAETLIAVPRIPLRPKAVPVLVDTAAAVPCVDRVPEAAPVLFDWPAPEPMNWWFVDVPVARPAESDAEEALPLKVIRP